jgi:hypothetical protein
MKRRYLRFPVFMYEENVPGTSFFMQGLALEPLPPLSFLPKKSYCSFLSFVEPYIMLSSACL